MRSDNTPPSSSSDPANPARQEETREDESLTGYETPFVFNDAALEEPIENDLTTPKILGERYRIENLLGEGGMGRVFRAFDQQLGRWVALKLLRPDSSASAERLLFEARSQARVDHAHVCKVYEAGKIDGRPFVAMQYIEGLPLNKAFAKMTLRQKLATMRQVAEGIHAAHVQGLIHRDLKPSNIMVQQNDGEDFRAYVLDFGLAREQAAPGVTTTGEVKGTPHYMAPEQVTGEVHTLDPRADVYGLGATLYEGLSGQPMYAETSGLGVLVKVLNEEPEPLRTYDPSLPDEVDTIVMKCLEKDPSKRYQSSQALAEDIQRFLDGDPLVAKRASLMYRWGKRLGKRKVAVLSWLLALVLIVAGALSMMTYFRIKDGAYVADLFRQDVEFIEETLQAAYTAPFHEITEEKGRIRERLALIHKRVETFGRRARGSGNYALGQGYIALDDYEQAKDHLLTAWGSGYKESRVAYALGQVMGVLYQRGLRSADQIEDPGAREAFREEIETKFRQRALEFLRLGSDDLQVDSPELPEALILLWEGRYQDALQKADQARLRMPHSYEPIKLTGDIYVAIGDERRRRGENELAIAAFDKAEAAYERALDFGRSDPRVYLGRCALGHPRVEMQIYGKGVDLEPLLEKSLRDCQQVLEIDPETAEAYRMIADLYWRQGEDQAFHGLDPSESARLAIEAANRALSLRPDDVFASTAKALSFVLLADSRMDLTSEDPTPYHDEARSAFLKALDIHPNHAPARSSLGYTYTQQARYQMSRGINPVPSLEQALREIEKAIEIRPTFTYAFDNLGTAYLVLAQWQHWQRQDPTADLERAKAAFAKASETNPNYIYAYFSMAEAYRLQAQIELYRGVDPSPTLEAAEKALEKGMEINAEEPGFSLLSGQIATLKGRFLTEQGRNPSAIFDRAEQDIERALELYSVVSKCLLAAASIDFWRAVWLLDNNRPASTSIERGLERLAQAIAQKPENAENLLLRGKLNLLLAEIRPPGRGRSTARTAAAESLNAAREINPVFVQLHASWFERLDQLGNVDGS